MLSFSFHVLCFLVPDDDQVMDLVLDQILADEVQIPAGAIVLAVEPEEKVDKNQPEAVITPDVGIDIVAADATVGKNPEIAAIDVMPEIEGDPIEVVVEPGLIGEFHLNSLVLLIQNNIRVLITIYYHCFINSVYI